MSEGLLSFLSVVALVALIATLAFFLIALTRKLRHIADELAEVAWGARAVERQLRAVKSNILQINAALSDIGAVAPGLVSMMNEFASRGGVRG